MITDTRINSASFSGIDWIWKSQRQTDFVEMWWQSNQWILHTVGCPLYVCPRRVRITLHWLKLNYSKLRSIRRMKQFFRIVLDFFLLLLLFWYSGPASHVLLGDLNYGSKADDAQPRQYRIVERIKHDGFKYPSKYNDIALVKIDGPVQFNNYVRPACLPQSRRVEATHVIASGWGRVSHNGDVSEHLQKVVLEIFTSTECNQSYSNQGRLLQRGIDDETQLCSGSHSDSKDTCQVSCNSHIGSKLTNDSIILCQSTICCWFISFFWHNSIMDGVPRLCIVCLHRTIKCNEQKIQLQTLVFFLAGRFRWSCANIPQQCVLHVHHRWCNVVR